MSTLRLFYLVTVAFLAGLAAGYMIAQQPSNPAGGDLTRLVKAAQKDVPLEREAEEFRRVVGAKEAVMAEVVAGRMSLKEAAGRFRILHEAVNGKKLPGIQPLPEDEKELAVHVLEWTREIQPAAEVMRRLEAEHRQIAE